MNTEAPSKYSLCVRSYERDGSGAEDIYNYDTYDEAIRSLLHHAQTGGCKVWLNGEVVFPKSAMGFTTELGKQWEPWIRRCPSSGSVPRVSA